MLTQTPEGVAKLAGRAITPNAPFTLVIEIDAWNIRERDNWGKTAAIKREIHYFKEHQNRMDYKTGRKLGQPVGSGAIESTCSQYQRRFKLTGQFWSLAGDEAFLALSPFIGRQMETTVSL